MHSNVEVLSPVKKKISFDIPVERVDTEIAKVYGEIQKHAAIKGFRKGKVPKSLIEKHFSGKMSEDVLSNLFNETFYAALKEHKIFPVSRPMIESDGIQQGASLKYSATVEVMPDVDLKDYTGLNVKKERFVFDEEVISKRLDEMRGQMAQIGPLTESRPVANGDFVVFDFKGFVGGEPFENGAAEDYMLEIGSGQFIPGFEEQIVGAAVGEEKDINVVFPEAYGNKELAGKEARFEIKVKEIKVKELPALDDELAKGMGEFETLEQLKAKMAEGYEKQERARIESDMRESLMQALIDKNSLELPESMVQRQLQYMFENAKQRLAYQKLTLEMLGFDENTFREQYRGAAETQVKGELLLNAVAEKEGTKVDDGDIQAEIKRIAESSNQSVEAVTGYYAKEEARENLAAHIREDKVVALLLEKAVVTEVAKEELK